MLTLLPIGFRQGSLQCRYRERRLQLVSHRIGQYQRAPAEGRRAVKRSFWRSRERYDTRVKTSSVVTLIMHDDVRIKLKSPTSLLVIDIPVTYASYLL